MRRPRASGALPDLFDDGWSRIRGGRGPGLPRPGTGAGARLRYRGQMVRAAQGHSPAVFKAIRSGGCHDADAMRRQLTYLTTKSTLILDPSGRLDGHDRLTPRQITALTKRLTDTWDDKHPSRLGHSSHLLMSFPIGTPPEAVAGVAERACRQLFSTSEGQPAFDYIIAVHTDRAHPHAHVVVNRHSLEGATFFLRSGHAFSYEAFREAMAEHGDAFGLRLEATRRLDRGHVAYPPRSVDVRRAREAGHDAADRPRQGPDRARAAQAVAQAGLTYRGLARAAQADGFEAVSEALQRASLTLARHGIILPTKELTMAATQGSYDGLLREFGRNVDALERGIAGARPEQRPALERGLFDAMASVASLNPLGSDSALLSEMPSDHGLYSVNSPTRDAFAAEPSPALRASLERALDGTGLSTAEVLARIRVGATSAALEEHWQGRDKDAMAAASGLDLALPAEDDQVIDRLGRAYNAVSEAFHHHHEQAPRQAAQAADAAREEAAWAEPFARVVPTVDAARADATLRATAARVRGLPAYAEVFPAAAPEGAHDFAAALQARLTPEEGARLAEGDRSALDRLAPDPVDRLALARAHLEIDPANRHSPAWQVVVQDLGRAQLAASRAAHGHEDGHTHD